MKGYGSVLAPVHAGIRYDLDQLMSAFKERESLRFRDFLHVYREKNMNLIFTGRLSAAELVEFSERLLQFCVVYIMPTRAGPPNLYSDEAAMKLKEAEESESSHEHSLMERVFGIYAIYTFYYMQATDYVVQIRITPSQMNELMVFTREILLKKRHLDTMACVYKLVDDGAFKMVAFENCYDPICHRRFDLPGVDDMPDEVIERDPPFEISKGIIDDSILKQLEIVHKKYEEGKRFLQLTHISTQKQPKNMTTELKEIFNDAKSKFDQMELADEIISGNMAGDEDDDDDEDSGEDLDALENGEGDDNGDGAPKKKKPKTKKARKSPNQAATGASRAARKDAAYAAPVKVARNRRYADPEMLNNFDVSSGANGEEMEQETSAGDAGPSSSTNMVMGMIDNATKARNKAVDDAVVFKKPTLEAKPTRSTPGRQSKAKAKAAKELANIESDENEVEELPKSASSESDDDEDATPRRKKGRKSAGRKGSKAAKKKATTTPTLRASPKRKRASLKDADSLGQLMAELDATSVVGLVSTIVTTSTTDGGDVSIAGAEGEAKKTVHHFVPPKTDFNPDLDPTLKKFRQTPRQVRAQKDAEALLASVKVDVEMDM